MNSAFEEKHVLFRMMLRAITLLDHVLFIKEGFLVNICFFFRVSSDTSFSRNIGGLLVESGAGFRSASKGKI